MNGNYAYSFKKCNPGGIGAALERQLLAFHIATTHSLNFCLLAEGLQFDFLNGFDPNCPIPKTWFDYFQPIQVLNQKDVKYVYPDQVDNTNPYLPPSSWTDDIFSWYASLLKKICLLQPDVQEKIEMMISFSGFEPSDAAIHLRRTDKIRKYSKSFIEADEIPLQKFVDACREIVPEGGRIMICSDDPEARAELCTLLCQAGYAAYWDINEMTSVHAQKVNGGVNYLDAWRENLNAIKTLLILSRAKYLIGARNSYLLQMAELLNESVLEDRKRFLNLGNNRAYGVAIYDESRH